MKQCAIVTYRIFKITNMQIRHNLFKTFFNKVTFRNKNGLMQLCETIIILNNYLYSPFLEFDKFDDFLRVADF